MHERQSDRRSPDETVVREWLRRDLAQRYTRVLREPLSDDLERLIARI